MHPAQSPSRPLRIAVAVAATVLASLAATAPTQAATIHACVKPKSGVTRIVSANAKCRHGEQKLSWNTTGPAGRNGDQGTAGANGAEGKAGASGQGPVYSASAGGTVHTITTETILLDKVLPPGSYNVSAKLVVGAESTEKNMLAAICGLVDAPGTSSSGEGTDVDLGFAEEPLGEVKAGEWTAVTEMTLQGTFTSTVTSTLSLGCGEASATLLTPKALYPQLQATMTSGVL